MLKLRRHSLFTLVSLVYLAALAVPSIHQFSYWAEPFDDARHLPHTDGSDQDNATVLHVSDCCATCDLIGTLSTLHIDAVVEPHSTHNGTIPSLKDDTAVAPHLSALSARAPPTRS